MEITSPSGRVYQWDRPTPPTEEDIRALQEYDAKQPPVAAPAKAEPVVASVGRRWDVEGATAGARANQAGDPRRVATMVADVGLEAGGAAGGQAAGAATGPFAPIATPVLGGIGGALGNFIAQQRQMKAGERDKYSWGEGGGAFVGGMIPGGSLARASIKTVAKEAGKNVVGNVAAIGTQTMIDEGRLPTAKEAAIAAGAAVAGTGIARGLDAGKNAIAAQAALEKAQDATRRETFRLGKELGYVLPPSTVRPSWGNDLLNTVGGSAATVQDVVRRNQKMTNRAIREELELPADVPLGVNERGKIPALESAKVGPMSVYGEVGAASEKAKITLELFRQKQADANMYRAQFRDMFPKDPSVAKAAEKAQEEAAEALTMLKKELVDAGKDDLIPKFNEARQKLAKIGLVESSVNKATGDVDAAIIGRIWDDNPTMLTGNLAKIGRFYNAFSQAVKDASMVPPSGVGQGLPLGSRMAMTQQDPSVALTFFGAPRGARDIMLSKPYQAAFVNFAYGHPRQDMPAAIGRFAPQVMSRRSEEQSSGAPPLLRR